MDCDRCDGSNTHFGFVLSGSSVTGTCDEAQPEGLNLAGVTNGGWGISWAQWMNGGTGGAVCTRTLIYSTDQSKWVVG